MAHSKIQSRSNVDEICLSDDSTPFNGVIDDTMTLCYLVDTQENYHSVQKKEKTLRWGQKKSKKRASERVNATFNFGAFSMIEQNTHS